MNNPFELVTASKLTASEATELWCDDSRLDRVRGRESCFINGNRGTGKSMLFRILQHDCQERLFPKKQPDFLSVYFPVRDSDFMVEEFKLMQSDRLRNALSESHLILLILRQLFVVIRETPQIISAELQTPFVQLVMERIQTAFEFSKVNPPELPCSNYEGILEGIIKLFDDESARIVNYVIRQVCGSEEGYSGPLFFFDGILAPVADFFFDEVGRCLFILIDDGDDLPRSHTIVLNSWIARRRRSTVFKVSTMYAYKTFETRSGSKIQQPHDFIQYDIATRFIDYSSEDYVDLVRRICIKRLRQAGLLGEDGEPVDPMLFFPEDEEQKARIKKVEKKLIKRYDDMYSGRSVRDYVYRHLTSEYMRSLSQKSALGSYRYTGFRTLAVLSGGLVRDFIICAQRMYDDASRKQDGVVGHIPPAIQDRIVRNHSDKILSDIGDARQKRSGKEEEWTAVANIIEGLGAMFKQKMLSQDSERRVFSFAFQSLPSRETLRLLDLAIMEGYLVRGFISKKEGVGRRYLYVLTRRIAPVFSLDVSAYSGYMSLEPSVIEMMALGKDKRDWNDKDVVQGDLFSIGPEGEWVITEQDGREAW